MPTTISVSQGNLVRAFVAVNIPEPAASELVAFLENLKPLAHLRWVKREQLHITLRFLGEQTPEAIARVKSALMPLRIEPFEVELSYTGAFPNLKSPNRSP